jgi:hypothetical protein
MLQHHTASSDEEAKHKINSHSQQNNESYMSMIWSGLRLLCMPSTYLTRKQMIMEILISTIIIAFAFSFSYQHFINESVQTLVPSTATSACATSPQLYVLPEQNVQIEFPIAANFINYRSTITTPYMAKGSFYGKWSSCRREAYDTNTIALTTKDASNISTISVPLSKEAVEEGTYSSSVESDDGCFSLSCGFHYQMTTQDARIKDIINNTLYILIPYTDTDLDTREDGKIYAGNCQIYTSLFITNNSVVATCAVSLIGTVQVVLTQSNSIEASGTYLCTTYTSTLQAVSAALSVTLTVIGVIRIYFLTKQYLASG